MPSTALVLLAHGFEEIEATTPIDLLRRAKTTVVLAACSGSLQVTGRSDITLLADNLVEDIPDPLSFDLLILPGGPSVFEMRAFPHIIALIRKFADSGKPIGAICAAPLLLLDAGILSREKSYTAHGSTIDELPHIQEDQMVIQDGQIITSRGAGTAVEFGLTLIHHLYGRKKEQEIRKSIHADLPLR